MLGDAIQAVVRVEASYGFDGELVGESHAIEQIMGIVRPADQTSLLTSD